jgi:ketosteroid isomerase-like protein
MSTTAHTPEELETLLEDTLMVGDVRALADLFDEGALLVTGDAPVVRGNVEIARMAPAIWHGERSYVADPRQVRQAQDIALIIAEGSINVARRDRDGAWRYAIVLLAADAQGKVDQ